MKTATSLALSALLALSAAPALAQSNQTMQGMEMQGSSMQGMNMDHMTMQGMKGVHMMSLKVSNVDMKTGILEGDTGGMKLRLHFPPASLADVKPGDTITVHMGFMKQK